MNVARTIGNELPRPIRISQASSQSAPIRLERDGNHRFTYIRFSAGDRISLKEDCSSKYVVT